MLTYLIRRFIYSVTIVIGISLLVFALVEAGPGDAVDSMFAPDVPVTPALKAQMRAQLGLDQPAPKRYWLWLVRVMRGDLGYSLVSQEPITHVILARLPATVQLVGFALMLSLLLGIGSGVLAAVKQYSWLDHITTFCAFAWLSIPEFFLGMLLIYIFALRLDWLPAFGASTEGAHHFVLDRIDHLVLPGLTLGLGMIAALTRYTRSSLLEVLHSDYMTTARAKGLGERTVILRHGLRMALIPIITIVALRLPYLIGGSVIIETVFQWPGLGLLAIGAAKHKDYPLVLTLTLAVSSLVVFSSLLADVVYCLADPRIRYGR